MDERRFAGQDHYEELFSTSEGWIVVVAAVQTSGSILRLCDIAIEPLDTKALRIGAVGVLSIQRAIEEFARVEGYTHLEISGHRISGANPNRHILLKRRLA